MKPKSAGTKRTASGGATGRSRNGSTSPRRYPYLAICVENRGNEESLALGKTYQVIKPLPNDPTGRIRVVDEEGEDYLYLWDWFVPVNLPPREKKRVLQAVVAQATG